MLQAVLINQVTPVRLTPVAAKPEARTACVPIATKPAAACPTCSLCPACLPSELPSAEVIRFGQIAGAKRRIARGSPVCIHK